VPASQCSAQNSVITHTATGRNVTFVAMADGAARIEPPANVALKDPRDWKLAGTPRRRLDLHDKVTGQPVFAIDVRLPDMLYAAVVHCPVFGGALLSVDEASIAGMKGVRRIVRMPDAAAVVAESWWQAKRASEALRITWDDRGNRNMSSATIEKVVREGLQAPSAHVARRNGDAAAALAGAARRIEADSAMPSSPTGSKSGRRPRMR
jgi:isoquinoline 1-oxidoreductase beta subunit